MSDIHLRNLRFLESCTTRLSETAQHAGSDGEGSGESGLGATLSTQNPQHWNLQAVQKKHVGRGYTVAAANDRGGTAQFAVPVFDGRRQPCSEQFNTSVILSRGFW